MREKTKNYIVSIGFVFVLVLFFALNIFASDKEISVSERRKLLQISDVTLDNFEEYASDQFVGRDFFKNLKSIFSTKILRQKDDNGVFIKDGAIYKTEYPLNENNVEKTAEKINKVYEKYLKEMNVYYSIIPDKNYYLEDTDVLKLDCKKIENILAENLAKDMKYVNIVELLALEDYYKTDLHWKQENLENVASKIKMEMNVTSNNAIYNFDYKKESKGQFYGSYYSQISNHVEPDTMNIVTNDIINSCKTFNYETKKEGKIYTEDYSYDKYDIFLDGASPLIEIENPNSKTDKELLLFRDSFGSSIAPLFVDSYKKIILIDLRYVSYELLEEYIIFENQDVLFLYNTLIINQNNLK